MTGALEKLTDGRDLRFREPLNIRVEKALRVAHCRTVSFLGADIGT